MRQVSQKQAERVWNAFLERYSALEPEKYGAILQPPGEGWSDDCWNIAWEEGPYDWAIEWYYEDPDGEVYLEAAINCIGSIYFV